MKKLLLFLLAFAILMGTMGLGSADTISYGDENVFNSGTTDHVSISFLNSTHFVVAYQDDGNGSAKIGTVSGYIISYGSEYEFNSASTGSISVTLLDSTHFVIAYQDSANSNYGTARVGTVSGTTITYGSEYEFNSASTDHISIDNLNSTHFVVGYRDVGNSNYGTARIGTVSGNAISYGSEYVFLSQDTPGLSISNLNSTHFLVACQCGVITSDVFVGSVSGTTISYGSPAEPNMADTRYISIAALDTTHFVVAYDDHQSTRDGFARYGVVTGGDTPNFYDAAKFNDEGGASKYTHDISITMIDSGRFIVVYTSQTDLYKGASIMGTVSGNAITYGSEYEFNSATTGCTAIDNLDDEYFIVVYQDSANSNYGTSIVGSTSAAPPLYEPPTPVNLTYFIDYNAEYISWDWDAGVGNVSDLYYVNLNGVWTNGTPNSYFHQTEIEGGMTYNITVYAYNSSYTGTLSAANVTDSQTTDEVYTPPTPVNLTSTEGLFWKRWVWEAGAGNVTESYNISYNGTWINGSATPIFNHTGVGAHGTSTIVVYAYNTSNVGTLSTANLTGTETLVNHLPVISANVIIGGATAGDTVTLSSAIATDADSDVMVDTYIWYLNSVEESALENESTVPSSYFVEGDTVQMLFNCSDGYGYSTLLSNTITIGTSDPAGGSSPPAGGPGGDDNDVTPTPTAAPDPDDYTPGGFEMAPGEITKSFMYTGLGKEQLATYEIASSAFLETCSIDIDGATCSIVDDYTILVNIPVNEGDKEIDGYIYGYTGDGRSQYTRIQVDISNIGAGVGMMEISVGDGLARLLNFFFITADNMITGIRYYSILGLLGLFGWYATKKKK